MKEFSAKEVPINQGLIDCIKGLYPQEKITDEEAIEASRNLICFFETLIEIKKKELRKERAQNMREREQI